MSLLSYETVRRHAFTIKSRVEQRVMWLGMTYLTDEQYADMAAEQKRAVQSDTGGQ